MRGEVHDENAFALGGAAGHAGLFGTIDGVLDVAERLLQGVEPWLAQMRTRQSATRCLGWEARHEGWSGGNACSEETIGHTGFTGTGVWIDFRRGLCWALLTNRVHPTRHRDTGIDALRRRVGDLIVGGVLVKGGRWSSCFAAMALLIGTSAASIAASIDDLVRAYPDCPGGLRRFESDMARRNPHAGGGRTA